VILGLGRLCQVESLGRKPELGNRKGAELHFEPDQPGQSSADHAGHRAVALIEAYALRDAVKDAEQKGSGAHRRIGKCHLG